MSSVEIFLRALAKQKDLGISPRFAILLVLMLYGKLRFSRLYKMLHMTPGNLKSHILALEKYGYVISTRTFYRGNLALVIEITPRGVERVQDLAKTLLTVLSKVRRDNG